MSKAREVHIIVRYCSAIPSWLKTRLGMTVSNGGRFRYKEKLSGR